MDRQTIANDDLRYFLFDKMNTTYKMKRTGLPVFYTTEEAIARITWLLKQVLHDNPASKTNVLSLYLSSPFNDKNDVQFTCVV
jgi:hypothetical protein